MARDTAPRLTFCYGGHDWNVTVWGEQDVKGWAGDSHLLWTPGDRPHWEGSLSLFMYTPVAMGLIWPQYNDLQWESNENLFLFGAFSFHSQHYTGIFNILFSSGWLLVYCYGGCIFFLLLHLTVKKPRHSITISMWLSLNMSGSATARTHTISLQ